MGVKKKAHESNLVFKISLLNSFKTCKFLTSFLLPSTLSHILSLLYIIFPQLFYYIIQFVMKGRDKNFIVLMSWYIMKTLRYQCSYCCYIASKKGTLKNHLQFIHEGKGEDCPICDTKHATKHHLEIHIEAKHLKE